MSYPEGCWDSYEDPSLQDLVFPMHVPTYEAFLRARPHLTGRDKDTRAMYVKHRRSRIRTREAWLCDTSAGRRFAERRRCNWIDYYDPKSELCQWEKHKSQADEPGFVYLLKCDAPGWYKLGETIKWKNRKNAYRGPTRPKPLFFARPVRRKKEAQYVLRKFLLAHGYKLGDPRCQDWLKLDPTAQTVEVRCPRWGRPRSEVPTGSTTASRARSMEADPPE